VQRLPDVEEGKERGDPTSPAPGGVHVRNRSSGGPEATFGAASSQQDYEPMVTSAPRRREIDPLRAIVWGIFWIAVATVWAVILGLALW
jgi:hypothetical protein